MPPDGSRDRNECRTCLRMSSMARSTLLLPEALAPNMQTAGSTCKGRPPWRHGTTRGTCSSDRAVARSDNSNGLRKDRTFSARNARSTEALSAAITGTIWRLLQIVREFATDSCKSPRRATVRTPDPGALGTALTEVAPAARGRRVSDCHPLASASDRTPPIGRLTTPSGPTARAPSPHPRSRRRPRQRPRHPTRTGRRAARTARHGLHRPGAAASLTAAPGPRSSGAAAGSRRPRPRQHHGKHFPKTHE